MSTHAQGVIQQAKEAFGINFELKDKQVEALHALLEGRDVMCFLRTGYGKSLIYQLTPYILRQDLHCNPLTLVISPLNSIMKNQVRKLCQSGVPACFLDMGCTEGDSYVLKSTSEILEVDAEGDDDEEGTSNNPDHGEDALLQVSVPISHLKTANFRLVYSHPEALLSTSEGHKLLRSKEYQERVCCIAIDEAHMIHEWGQDFRKDFSRMQEVLGLFPRVPTVVLSATASSIVQATLIRDLALKNPVKIIDNPDRVNIKYRKIERLPSTKQEDDLDDILSGIAEGLKKEKGKYPITLVYTDLEGIRYSYRFFESALGKEQYIGPEKPENRLFAQYHNHYTKAMKEHIVSEMSRADSLIRVVFATVALGMGFDPPTIRKVIHFKSPTSIEKYLQETGRAGRDGKLSEAVLYVNNTDTRSNRPGQQKEMTEFCRSKDVCLREQLLKYLGFEVDINRQFCHCCSVCEIICDCNDCSTFH